VMHFFLDILVDCRLSDPASGGVLQVTLDADPWLAAVAVCTVVELRVANAWPAAVGSIVPAEATPSLHLLLLVDQHWRILRVSCIGTVHLYR
jgi:hypothetical protein